MHFIFALKVVFYLRKLDQSKVIKHQQSKEFNENEVDSWHTYIIDESGKKGLMHRNYILV